MVRNNSFQLKSEKRDAKRKVRMKVHNFGVKSRPKQGISAVLNARKKKK